MNRTLLLLSMLSMMILFACKQKAKNTLFTSLSPDQSGIHFSNDIHETDSTHSFINEFGYMGGGVGIGDFNNDGLKDIFFTGNQVSCRLYINKGDNKFEDITEKAGLHTELWATGVSIVDINNDGYDDIYVCAYGKNLMTRSKNLLFINQHNLTFKEEAGEYGLADLGYSTQAAFLDYDHDGDLDMYLANYLFTTNSSNNIVPIDHTGFSQANDRLYRNDGDSAGVGHPVFHDVTIQAGIKEDGYGLGLAVTDINNDGYPDVYVADDFISNDELWLNNKNNTFTNCINRSIRHQSYSSMGVDAADLNNDGLTDIVTLDMLPEDNKRKKTAFFFMNYERYQAERNMGYAPEFMRNMMQINNGNYQSGDTSLPYFSEIGQMAGIAATDWSWSVLLADFNNDGWKDVHITNGIGRDFIDGDFLEFSNEIFTGGQTRAQQEKAIRERLASRDHVNLANYLYLNNRDLTFSDVSDTSGVNEPSMSNGAAYADLDNDGDLDLVVNNISKEAFVFINNTIQKDKPITSHYIGINLKGRQYNVDALGTRVKVYAGGVEQVQEENPVRGYFSTVDRKLLFGLGENKVADSIIVYWPLTNKQKLVNVPADTVLNLSEIDASLVYTNDFQKVQTVFSDITSEAGIAYRHHDNSFNDFAIQRLLPQKYSQLGPFITTGDINNDGNTDFFVGGGFNFSGQLFTQQKNYSFTSTNLTDSIKMEEDEDVLLFDADGDGDQDLIITGGDILFDDGSPNYHPRFYLNDGKGNFTQQFNAIPVDVSTIAGVVTAADYDGDGDLDLFIGGRVSKKYPTPPRSFILQNNKGVFTNITATACPELQNAGMITSAVWTDFDNDHQIDLIIAGEWMPIRFFKNTKGFFQDVTKTTGLTDINGMWRSLIAVDMDHDGDMDLVAGNLGLNCLYKVSDQYPMEVMASDIDGNGSIDPVFFYYIKDKDGKRKLYPAISRSQFAEQVPSIKKTFLHYADYANATADDIFKGKAKDNLLTLQCNETRSCYFKNIGNGKFKKIPLPNEAQWAPVNAILCDDFDGDGINDLLLAGNEYQADVMTGPYDASYGFLLKGNTDLGFSTVPSRKSGLRLNGDVKDLALVQLPNKEKIILVSINADSLRVLRINESGIK
ncbi:MAG: VCBS repeat-containing protein [Chitinophagaceae bacterium]